MAASAREIVGRDAELAVVRELLDTSGPRAVVVEGAPGLGKSTLWEWGVAAARDAGTTALVARPAESERLLPYAALGDLLDPIFDHHADHLPEVQRRALETALLRGTSNEPAEHLAVARATLSLVDSAAEQGPVLVAIDDVQWLDALSTRTLEFVVRRLRVGPTRMLVAHRTDRAASSPLGLERGRPDGSLVTLTLGPLDTASLDALLRTRLGLELTRPRLLRLERITEGNPYYALEIAPSLASSDGLLVPTSLSAAIAERLHGLPRATRDAVLLAAACVRPTPDLVERAAGTREGLAHACELGLVEATAHRLRFTHPLLASVAYTGALPGDQRDAHRRLAAAADDPEERALHVARGSEAKNETVARELEETASRTAAHGGQEAAAELAEAAARLSLDCDTEGKRRRLLAASDYHVAAGDPVHARLLLEGVIAGLDPGPERAAVLWRLADTIGDSIEEPVRLCEQALVEAADEPLLTSEVHTALGVFTWIAGDLERATEHCRQAVTFAERAGDDLRLAVAIGEACHAEAILGVPWNRVAMQRALKIEETVEDMPLSLRPSVQLAVISLVTDELDTARRLLTETLERARRAADEPATFHALFRIAELELREGNLAEALRAAREATALTRQGGIVQEQAAAEMVLALVHAHIGALDEARDLGEDAYRSADAGGDRGVAIRCAGVLGFVEISAGHPDLALEWLTPARRELEAMGTGELSISGVVQNELEALVAVGSLEEADAVVEFVERKARRSGRAWHRVVAARGRALVASARGESEAARTSIDEALAAHAELPQPFELARTLFAAGFVERRAKHWALARERFTAALELCDDLGAAPWAERAAAELGRLPGRRPRTTELTATESRVAELVAEGLSNKDVAARLFVTVRTVEANLSRVYAKLGVRSRTELTRKLVG